MTEMTEMTDATNNALEIRNVSKHFGATIALSGVDLSVRRGEVHALLGENGSGKSTLVKVLAGVHDPEPGGSLRVGDRDVPLPLAPGEFRGIGLSFVHQDLGLARPLTVLENLFGGVSDREDSSRWRIRWRQETRRAREMLSSYGVDIDPRAIMDRLPPVGQALVAIARAAEDLKRYRERTGATASVLVLDEPTVFLPEDELSFLFDLIRSVVASGSSVVFISHDLAAVREIADRVTVLRDGRVTATASMSDVSDEEIVEYIVGQAAAQELDERTSAPIERRVASEQRSEIRLQVNGLSGERVKDLDLTVGAGEIVGLAGLMGSGAEEVPYLLFGSGGDGSGEITVEGRSVPIGRLHPAKAVSLGIAMIPADRNRDAIAKEVSVSENMMLLVIRRFWLGGRLRNRSVRRTADERADVFDIRPRDTSRPAGTLSGGNAQKVVLAKWLEIEPHILLLHEPTQGVDVAARSQIYRIIQEATQAGMAVLWASTDFDELATVCDRVEVMSNGVRSSTISGEQLTPEQITTAVFEGATGAPHVPAGAAAQAT